MKVASTVAVSRRQNIEIFYDLLWECEEKFGLWSFPEAFGAHKAGRFPDAGVYFFFESGELRAGRKNHHRVVRVGSHRVSEGSCSRLVDRLAQHYGTTSGCGGDASIFRVHIGSAMTGDPAWADDLRSPQRAEIHQAVSDRIRQMDFVALPVDDGAGKGSDRRLIEIGAISLLSNYRLREPFWIDPPSPDWLGRKARAKRASTPDAIAASGLWNVDGVDQEPDARFLKAMAGWLRRSPSFA